MNSKADLQGNLVTCRPLRIGIVGAGLVGATAAIALSRLRGVSVAVFERSPGPRETGAWISLTVSGLIILDKLIDLEKVQNILYRGDHNGTYVTRHWRTGEIIASNPSSPHVANRFHQARTHRVPLLNVLLSNVPQGVIQYDRHVVGHEVTESGVRLNFKYSASETFDLVVAADGLFSKMRRHYVPDEVRYRGSVAYRKLFPQSQVAHITGLHNDSSSWRKDGEVMFLSPLGLGQYGIVAIIRETDEFAETLQWAHSTGKEGLERLRKHFATWDPIIDEVLQTMTDIDAYPLDSAPWMKQLVRHDRIAFVGDAAHPTAGAYGAGATMGQGDCWALFRSLQESYWQPTSVMETDLPANHIPRSRYDLQRALQLYDATRRPFLARVELQIQLDGADGSYISEAADDEEEWIRRFQERHRNQLWLTEHDVEAEFVKTLAAAPVSSSVKNMISPRL
ncbi:Uncharacterized protein BP5553_07110 [Venustampulla echinocandica]|uniref:FAD-binding domain-containing protein n=1 Tax=Venustampulla echinocandica TaxID=2656787 RepID=A0A370TIJ3_9HELO|nr:Uncharacterized protein BP5553_07110 [Venustampulla echinocandica]RDL35179.1 Uncharacterized protein BP5553_07110 [Venustampulla echinocandica]